MKRLVHINEAERRSAPKRAGWGAAIAVAGLIGAAGCATTQAPVPRYSLDYGESATMTDFGINISAVRLRLPLSDMTGRDARFWTEDRSSVYYRSILITRAQNMPQFAGAAYVEEDGRWYFSGLVKQYSEWLRTARGADAAMPSQMEIIGDNGVCRMDAEAFRAIIRQVSGREMSRMRPISEEGSGLCHDGVGYTPATYYRIHFLPLDTAGNTIGQYRGGQLALTTSYSPYCPEIGCLRGITLLVEPGAEDPRNVQP